MCTGSVSVVTNFAIHPQLGSFPILMVAMDYRTSQWVTNAMVPSYTE